MSNESKARYLQELGTNLIKISKRLMENQTLLKLLKYTDKDPLKDDSTHPDVTPQEAYGDGSNGLIRIIPLIPDKENAQSLIVLRVINGIPDKSNDEFMTIRFAIDVFVPNKQWIIKNSNLRPYAIIGEIQKTLDGKKVNGLGEISGSGFSINYFTNDMSAFTLNYSIIQYA